MSSNAVLNIDSWDPTAFTLGKPKTVKNNITKVPIYSSQTKKYLGLNTPQMTCFGITDYVENKESGVGNGKFSCSLSFPNSEYSNAKTDKFLEQLLKFEDEVVKKVCENKLWQASKYQGKKEETIIDIIVDKMKRMVKYPKIKDPNDPQSKAIDLSRPPSLSLKVDNFDNKWNVQIFTDKGAALFPSSNPDLTPCDFVPKFSLVKCYIECMGIWTGELGWGITWKLKQCAVTQQMAIDVNQCMIEIEQDEEEPQHQLPPQIQFVETLTELPQPVLVEKPQPVPSQPPTFQQDSDDEAEERQPIDVAPPAPAPALFPIHERPAPESEPLVKKVKKVVKKVNTAT
jgi:hypothetical protein